MSEQYQSLDNYIATLSENPDREPVASELGVLQSIYGDESIKVWKGNGNGKNGDTETVRYEVTLTLPDPFEDVSFSVLVSLPPTYPATSPPQLQILSRYIGPFGVDSTLFGAVLRTYISSEGVEYIPDSVCVFDGLEWVKERCAEWFSQKKSEKAVGELLREDERGTQATADHDQEEDKNKKVTELVHEEAPPSQNLSLLQGIEIVEAEPIVDRKSAFVGRACRITDPSQVPLVLSHLLSDRRIARATHPIINAWRCQVGNVLHQDNDDDGETAAGGRLAHLLQILEVNNVLVVVTRYFGGIHLGPDRFKHINQAARNALELGGFLDDHGATQKRTGRGKKR
ncbi:imprinted and ancient [Panus rudis PR-1116 ss-1]|nr:imprinted and ancient [Panus rudis PR-1116 ss-1]